MFDFSALRGNETVKKILSGRSFHACLIEGPDCENRDTLSSLVAMSLLCTAETKPCGECKNCRKFLAGNHPDVVRIDGSVSVEEMRRALSGILLLPNEAPVRVYIIENAHTMSDLVQNILLKPIEEPPEFAAFLLVSQRAEALLETIRSRCCILPVEADTVPEIPENVFAFINSVEAGIFSEAEQFLEFSGREDQREFFRACLREVRRRLLDAAKNGEEKQSLFYGRLDEIFSGVAAACEYNVNMKLWNTVLLARCFSEK